MKKILLPIIIVLLLGGCAKTVQYTGREKIERAREMHTALSGADITMTDNVSGEVIQQISYLFVGEAMTYMYMGAQDGKLYYEYNNGTELDWITLPDDTEWSFAAKGSEDYYGYSKASRHYFADGARLFAVYETAIESTEWSNDTLSLSYDEEKLAEYAAFSGMEIEDFTLSYSFCEQGQCKEFTNEYTLDGEKHSYTVSIGQRTEPVERTEVFVD